MKLLWASADWRSMITMTTALVLVSAGTALCQATQRDVDALQKSSLIYIATVRKDGNQSKPAPVWFTVTADHIVLINTGPDTWKVKRVRRGSPVIVWIGSENGPAFIGKAEITTDSSLLERIIHDYPEKYTLARIGLFRPSQAKFDGGKAVAIKIMPVRDLEGFTSSPGSPAPTLAVAATGASPTPVESPAPSVSASPSAPAISPSPQASPST